MFVFVVCCTGSVICDKLITHSESPTGCLCVIVCDLVAPKI